MWQTKHFQNIKLWCIAFLCMCCSDLYAQKHLFNSLRDIVANEQVKYERCVFSRPHFMVSFHVPENLKMIDDQLSLDKFNSSCGTYFKVKKGSFWFDQLLLSNSEGTEVLSVQATFAHSLELGQEKILPNKNPDETEKNFLISSKIYGYNIKNLVIGNIRVPLLKYERLEHFYPSEMYSSVMQTQQSDKPILYVSIFIHVNHLMGIRFEYFSAHHKHYQECIGPELSKSLLLHKLTYSNTSLFDDFEEQSGFLKL